MKLTKHTALVLLALFLLVGCQESAKTDAPATTSASQPAGKDAKSGPASQPAGKDASKGPASQPASNAAGGAPASQPASMAAKSDKVSVDFGFPAQDNAKIFATSKVSFLVNGMTVTPAGEAIKDQTKGHHHLIIDGKPIPKGQPVPADAQHIHFGKGQTEAEVKLTPGKHTLTMQFADGAHLSYGAEMSATRTVEVVADPPSKKVFFAAPADGAKVKSPLKVQFGIEGFGISPAGEKINDKTVGHHHLIIDGKPIALGLPVPADEQHIHFGKGQTEAEVKLTPGKHTLTMQLADGAHISYGPDVSATITVEVE